MANYYFGRSAEFKVDTNNRIVTDLDGLDYLVDFGVGDFIFAQMTNIEPRKPDIHLILKCTKKGITEDNKGAEFILIADLRNHPLPKNDFVKLVFFNLDTNLLNLAIKQGRKNFVQLNIVANQRNAIDHFLQLPEADIVDKLKDTSSDLFRKLRFENAAPKGSSNDLVFFPDPSCKSGYRYKDEDFIPKFSNDIDNRIIKGINPSAWKELHDWLEKQGKGTEGPTFQQIYNAIWQRGTGPAARKQRLGQNVVENKETPSSITITDTEEKKDVSDWYDSLPNHPENSDGYNKIYFGIPGCGKSYNVNEIIKGETCFRTTFYEDYSYSDFLGQVRPVSEDGNIQYKFVPGPFALALQTAFKYLKNGENKNVYLVIEEINRGNAPSIFGDFFQLLDRDKNGKSCYPISNQTLQDYLNDDELNNTINFNEIFLPYNLIIYGTMNTSDQNVFTLDTAFKRRFDFELVENKKPVDKYKHSLVPGTEVLWTDFVAKINEAIVSNKGVTGLFDDKRLGYYFVDERSLFDSTKGGFNFADEECAKEAKRFAYKVLEYLYDDVNRFGNNFLFSDQYHTLDEIIGAFLDSNLPISNERLNKIFKNVKF